MFELEYRKLHTLVTKHDLFFLIDWADGSTNLPEKELESIDAVVIVAPGKAPSMAKNCVQLPNIYVALGMLSVQVMEGKVVLLTDSIDMHARVKSIGF